MAVIALTSASGSPGVTTTALGLTLLWPRAVLLVEADPTGGSGVLAGFFRGAREYDSGLIELALSSYDITDEIQVFGSVNNLIDRAPVIAPGGNGFPTNPVYFDTFGRTFRIGARVKL